MAQYPDNKINPEQIFQDYESGILNNSEAVYLLKTLIEHSSKISLRFNAIQMLGYFELKDYRNFNYFESYLLSDEHQLIRALSAIHIYRNFPTKCASPLRWAAKNDGSPLVRKVCADLAEKTNEVFINSHLTAWDDLKTKYLPEFYGVIPEEIDFVSNLDIFIDEKYEGHESLKRVEYEYRGKALDGPEDRHLIHHWFHGGFKYIVRERRLIGLFLPEYGELIFKKFLASLQKLSNLEYLSMRQLRSIPKSLTSLLTLRGLDLQSVNRRRLKLPDNLTDLKNLKVIKLHHSFFNPMSNTLFALIKQNIASQYISEGVHPDDAVCLGVMDAYFGHQLENNFNLLPYEICYEINDLGRVVKISILDGEYFTIHHIPLPLFTLIQLEELIIRGNLIGDIPSKIKKLTHLRKLDLSRNNVSDISNSIKKLKKLEWLSLEDNWETLTEFPRVITKLTSLKYLNLAGTRIRRIPDSISNLKNLETLKLPRKNQIDYLPASIKSLKNLKNFDIYMDLIKD